MPGTTRYSLDGVIVLGGLMGGWAVAPQLRCCSARCLVLCLLVCAGVHHCCKGYLLTLVFFCSGKKERWFWQILLTGTTGYGLAGRYCSRVLLGMVWLADAAHQYYWV